MRVPMFKKIGPEFQFKKIGADINVGKDKIGMPMFKKIRVEFQC